MNITQNPKEYAQYLLDLGFTYADYVAQYGHYEGYSELVRQAMADLGDTTAIVESEASEDVLADSELAEAELNELGLAYEEGADYILAAHIATVWGLKTEDATAAAIIGRVICNNRGWSTNEEVHTALKIAVKTLQKIVY